MHLPFSGVFQDLHHFLAHRDILGIDIGTAAIKAVHLTRGADRPVLTNYGILETTQYLERGNAAIQTSSLKLAERETTQYLTTLLREMGSPPPVAVASLPAFAVFTAPLEMPVVPPDETARLVQFQAKQFVPLPMNEVSIEWTKIDEFDSQRGARYQRLLVTAVPTATVDLYQRVCRAAGVKLLGIELEHHALARALASTGDAPFLLVDIGAESTALTVIDHGVPRQFGQTDYAGAALTQALARSLGVSAWRAEELKRRRGLLVAPGEYDLAVSLTPFLDAILQECGRVRGAYEAAYHTNVGAAMLVGGGADLPGIEEYVVSQLQLPLLTHPLFTRVSLPAGTASIQKSLARHLALALGLGLKILTPTE